MSREIVLLSGPDDAHLRERRSKRIRHAAARVPGSSGSRVVETPTAAVALVETDPPGGSSSSVREGPDGLRVTVSTNDAGVEAAAGPGPVAERAAEAGHVSVRIAPDGAVVATTDGMASVPSYWAEHDHELVFSTHLPSLVSLGVPADLDEQALFEYLVMLHPLQQRTLLRSARLLAPGGRLDWAPGKEVQHTARPIFVPPDDSLGEPLDGPLGDDDAVRAFGALWNDVISDLFARHAGQRIAFGLSGGLDSRAMTAAAAMLGERPMTFSYGTGRSSDTRTATAVARRLGLPHRQLPVTDDHLMPDATGIAERLDAAHSPAEMFELWFGDALGTFADVVVNGAGGGPLWGDEKTLGLTDAALVTARVWQRYGGAARAAQVYLAPEARVALPPAVRGGIADSLAEWDLSARADMTVYWRVANRQVRWGNMLINAVRRAGLRSEMPFLDARFLRFAARLTPDQRRNGRLHLRIQRETFPATADIGRSDDGNSPRGLSHVYWSGDASYPRQLLQLGLRHPVSATRRAARRATEVGVHTLRRRTALSRPADWWDQRTSVFPVDLWARTRPVLAGRLAALVEAADPVALVDQSAVERAADDLRAGRFTGSALALARIATAQLWLTDYARRAADLRRLDG